MPNTNPSNPLYPLFEWIDTTFNTDIMPDPWLLVTLGTIVFGGIILASQLVAPWFERKVMSRMQGRRGPVYVGWKGILQIPADLVKLVLKEDVHPENIDRFGFTFAVFATAVSSVIAFSPLPFGSDGLIGGNYTIGFLYVFAVFSIFPPAMFIGGWASNSKYSLIGGFRSAAQLIAYEIPMLVSVLGVFAVVGSFSLVDISDYQIDNGWFMFRYLPFGLVAAFIFFISGIAETERVPFDIPEDEASLVMGPRTEFASWRYAMLMMVEYLHLFVNAMLFIYVFMGGYHPLPITTTFMEKYFPSLAGAYESFTYNPLVQVGTILAKTMFFVGVAALLRSALPRLRIDQFLTFGWKYLLPASLLAFLGFLAGPEINLFGLPWWS